MDKEQLIKELQASVAKMKEDDLEENPDAAEEHFQCDCCGKDKILAGSMIYNQYRLCNDCVLLAEASFALKKIENIEQLLENMEDKRFENLYHSIFDNVDNASPN